MNKWVFRIIWAAVLIGIGFWIWRVFFPSPEQVIRKRLNEMAQIASFSSNEGPLAKAANASKFTTFFNNDVEIAVDVPGRAQQVFRGRDELLQAAMGARSFLGSLKVEFLDINITLAADKMSAVVNLTAKGRAGTERDLIVQELKLILKKVGGDWLIQRLETVKTLS